MIVRRVVGNSMKPTLRDGQIIIGRKKQFSINDVVVANVEGREVIKRVIQTSPKIEISGDNKNSAVYDDVKESAIVGVVIWPKIKH